jgi:uncharacterized membrane protein YozB (DUF420 family)
MRISTYPEDKNMVFLIEIESVFQLDIPVTNLIVQIGLVLLLILGGLILAKRRKLQLHGNIMRVAVVVGILMTLAVMLPSLISVIGIYSAFPSLAMVSIVHGILGIVAGVIAIVLVFKKFGTVKNWMRVIFSLWIVSFLTGILVFSFYF